MAIERTAEVVWEGPLASGSGEAKGVSSNAFSLPVTWSARTEAADGMTSPEELIAAAHAGCYSMALSGGLVKAGFAPEHISTTAVVHLDKGDSGFSISGIELNTEAKVGGEIDEARFQEIAAQTKDGCPVSRALAAIGDISVTAKLL